ncbi:pentatricopeptide repeat-containing protein At1g71460, chloroplastic [Oryza brachyantha]|uniref:pentatricopeptide repeat-containing protein At1g71460, chloroplastic n=1 Tax=Oryza brachyantha TaxID=4533 RepID=UPI001ADB6C5E|nr:pentatricopeptide repeat-containing protein At1g71460, chloroplastic [Oryza brachyantha]
MASSSSSLAAPNHPKHHLKPVSSPKPLNQARPLSRAPLAGAAAYKRASSSSQAELRPDSKNAPALSAELRRLARVGRLPSALALLDHLSHRGVPATASAFAALLSACRSLPHARQVHAHLRVHGLDSNEFLLARLVELYLALGAAEDARQVLDGLPRASSFSWNALLHGHVRRGRGQAGGAVADGFSEMRAAGADANEYTYGSVLKSISGSAARSMAMATATHAMLIKNAYAGAPQMLMTGLMDVYFKCGKVKPAVRVFEEMPERDVVAWGAVIAGFAHKGMKREALEHFRWMVEDGIKVNSVVLTSVVPVIGELRARNLGREIHAFVLKKFQDRKDVANIQAGLVDMYCKCGDMISGRRVFYSTKKRNVVSWTALMSGYASNGRQDQALRCILWMQQEGIRPDLIAVGTVLPVCTKLKALRKGKELHAYALRRWFLPNVSLCTSLITMYGTCSHLDYSQGVFHVMDKKTVQAWTALVDAYLKNGDPSTAVDVFRSMLLSNRRPDAVAITRMLSACRDTGASKLGKELHGQALKLRMEPLPLVAAGLISMYGTCGDLKAAQRVFNRTESKGSLTCTAIIEAYAINQRHKDALELFAWMLSNRFVPNNGTFDVLLRICEAAGLHDEALQVFNSMVQEYNLEASEQNFDCIIRLLTAASRTSEAQRFANLKATLFNLSTPSWNSKQQ